MNFGNDGKFLIAGIIDFTTGCITTKRILLRGQITEGLFIGTTYLFLLNGLVNATICEIDVKSLLCMLPAFSKLFYNHGVKSIHPSIH